MQALNAAAREDILRWSRVPGSPARDGVPAAAFAPDAAAGPGRLAQRDFDLGRHIGLLPAPEPDEPPPAATAVLVTPRDSRDDWLRAGQALHRVLAHAATEWVSASLHTQPLESRRSGTSSAPGWRYRGQCRCCCSSDRRAAACPPRAGRWRTS